jgi:hypothetical protein
MRSTVASLAALLAVAVLPAGATAASTNAPAGNSGISQYLEVVQSSTGAKPTTGQKAGRNPLSEKTQKALAEAHRDGERLSQVVASTAPAGAAEVQSVGPSAEELRRRAAARRESAARRAAQRREAARRAAKRKREERRAAAVALAYRGGGGSGGAGTGIGVPLIVLMAASALAVGAMSWGRHRGGRPEPGL